MIKLSKKILLLIVEDEIILADTLEEKLKSEGFEVIKAYNGEEGLNIALTKHPNLILLDLLLPKIDGMTVFKKIRNDIWGKAVPVIILTNLSDAEVERNGNITNLQPSYYFIKANINLEEIVEKIKKRLDITN